MTKKEGVEMKKFSNFDLYEVEGRMISLYQQCFSEAPWFECNRPDNVRRWLYRMVLQVDSRSLVSEEVVSPNGKQIVGAIFSFPADRERRIAEFISKNTSLNLHKVFYVAETFVDPDFRRRGIATAMLKEVMLRAMGISFHFVAVRTHEDSKMTPLLEKNGFLRIGEQEVNARQLINGVKREVSSKRTIFLKKIW